MFLVLKLSLTSVCPVYIHNTKISLDRSCTAVNEGFLWNAAMNASVIMHCVFNFFLTYLNFFFFYTETLFQEFGVNFGLCLFRNSSLLFYHWVSEICDIPPLSSLSHSESLNSVICLNVISDSSTQSWSITFAQIWLLSNTDSKTILSSLNHFTSPEY